MKDKIFLAVLFIVMVILVAYGCSKVVGGFEALGSHPLGG